MTSLLKPIEGSLFDGSEERVLLNDSEEPLMLGRSKAIIVFA